MAAKRLELLASLRRVLRSDEHPERMLRSIVRRLAVDLGHYCIADVIDQDGVLRRLDIAHADARLHAQLQVAAEDTRLEPDGRVARLLASGGSGASGASERLGVISSAARARILSDVVLPNGEVPRSYMSVAVSVSGAPMAVITVVTCQKGHPFSSDDLDFLVTIADWCGLGLENALRRQLQPRTSVAPPARASAAPPAQIRRTSTVPTR